MLTINLPILNILKLYIKRTVTFFFFFLALLYLFVVWEGAKILSFLSIIRVVVGFPVERIVCPVALEHYLLTKLSFSVN